MTIDNKDKLKATLYSIADMQFESIVAAMEKLEVNFPGHTEEEYTLICNNTLDIVQRALIDSSKQTVDLFNDKIKDIKQEDFDV